MTRKYNIGFTKVLLLVIFSIVAMPHISCGGVGSGGNGDPVNADLHDGKLASFVSSIETVCAEDIAVYKGVMYIANGPFGIDVYDITNPSTPVFVRVIPTKYAIRLYVFLNYLYLCDGPDGIKVYDLSTPSNPAETFREDTEWATSAALHGNYLFVGDYFAGFRIYSMDNPSRPSLVQALARSRVSDITFDGNTLLINDAPFGLATYFMKSPTTPQCTFTYNDGRVVANYGDVIGYRGFAITTRNDEASRISIFYTKNIGSVRLVSEIFTARFVEGLTESNGTIFVACGEDGVKIYDIRKLPDIREKHEIETPGYARLARVFGNYLYIADMSSVIIYSWGGSE